MATEIYPVVHINEVPEAVEQSQAALELGADGVYLIDHENATTDVLFETFQKLRDEQPDAFIGVNALCLANSASLFKAFLKAKNQGLIDTMPDGAWVDDCLPSASETDTLRNITPSLAGIRYLGGIAFKYTDLYSADPVESANLVKQLSYYVDVVTTSGAGTGRPPSPEKISAMKAAAGHQPLAVASGVSVENLDNYNGDIDQLLVASSVETTPGSGVFDQTKLQDLIDLAQDQ